MPQRRSEWRKNTEVGLRQVIEGTILFGKTTHDYCRKGADWLTVTHGERKPRVSSRTKESRRRPDRVQALRRCNVEES